MNVDMSWLACIFPTSWFKSHMIWATEVWAHHNHKIPLSPLAWPWVSLPGTPPASCAKLDLGHPAPTCVLTEHRAHHQGHHKQKPCRATSLHTHGWSFVFQTHPLDCFPWDVRPDSRWEQTAQTELPPRWATRVYVQEQSQCHSHVWLTIQKTITVWHNPCICYFRGLVGRRWQRFRSQWSPSALQTRQDCWALFSFGSFPSISTLRVTPIGNSVSVSS